MADKVPTWTVVAQVEDFGPDDGGQFTQGVRVSFRTASGATGSVFVPSSRYTVEHVREVIDGQAQAMQAVSDLSG